MVSDRRWKNLVREGKSLVLEGAAGRLRLGQIAQEIAPRGDNGGDRRSDGFSSAGAALEEYAVEVDIEANTLREYRDVLMKWGGNPEAIPATSWTVLRELAAYADPAEAYRLVKRDHGVVNTVTVRIYRKVPDWNHQKETPVRSQAAQVRELLKDPAVAREVADDPDTRQNFRRAETAAVAATHQRNQPGYPQRQRAVEIEHAEFFRSLATIGADSWYTDLKNAERGLALLCEHDVWVPGEALAGARKMADEIGAHLAVLLMRADMEARP